MTDGVRTIASGALFARGYDLPEAVSAQGCWITDRSGRRYLDAASGALVANLGHGDGAVIEAIHAQMRAVAYVHPTALTSESAERYAEALSSRLPMSGASIYPVSGGSEAVETALKAARTYHLARGEPERTVVIGRDLSYHGNTRGALDVSGRETLRGPYEVWLGRAERVPAVTDYRCPNPGHPRDCAGWHATRLEEKIEEIGAERVAAFIAEPVGGAASGATVPPDGYWDLVAEVCARNGVLVIADEVMTGFGRTGRWFASENFGLRPDIVALAKGAASGYWPLGVCAFSGDVTAALTESGFIHGFTYSHNPVGCAAGLAVLGRIEALDLVEAASQRGALLTKRLEEAVGEHRNVGDVRGIGLLLAVELVADRSTKEPFPVEADAARRLSQRAREEGLLVYPSTGCAGGMRGDLIMIGPPLIIDEEEIDLVAEKLARALEAW